MLIDDIRNGESDQLEFKEIPNRDSAKWLKTVVAFANGRGGRIVFGVANDRRVVGLDGDLFAMRDGIADAIANACSPAIPFELCVSTVEGRPVAVLEVSEGRQTPYFIRAKGDVEGVYVRYDTTTRLADEMSLRELRVEGSGRGYDEVKCRGLQVKDAEVSDLCERMHKVAMENAASDDERKGIKPLPPNAGGNSGGKLCRSDHAAQIIALMRRNPKISVSAMVSAIGGGKRSIEREIAALKASGRIERKGTYAGEWIVQDA